jgi:hypothetical protein
MLVFSNLTPTSTFSLVLLGKEIYPDLPLFLVLTRQANLVQYEYELTNTSTSDLYQTFTITTSNLPKGDYDVKIYNGDYLGQPVNDCVLESPIEINDPELFICDPLTVETSILLNSTMIVSEDAIASDVIYTAKAKVNGTEETFWVNQSTPTYVVYEG